MPKYTVLAVCLLVLNLHRSQCDIIETIKDGFKTAYDEVHCGFHKVKELVHHHEHDVDPCDTKTKSPVEASTPFEEILSQPTLKPDNYGLNNAEGVLNNDYNRRINGENIDSTSYNVPSARPPYTNNNNRLNSNPVYGSSANQESYGWREGYTK